VTRRAVIVLLTPVPWHPPGVDPLVWRTALAEDVVDLLATLSEVEPAIATTAADRSLAAAVAWPTMPVYEVSAATPSAAFAAAAEDGYDQAVVLAADVPDLPALLIGKLLRPLSTRTLSIAPASAAQADASDDPDHGGPGLLGMAARLPAPDWLPDVDLDRGSVAVLRAAAPRGADVAVAPGWRRMRGPADLGTLDLAIEGWDATRALLTA
jgi:hypothetical protein